MHFKNGFDNFEGKTANIYLISDRIYIGILPQLMNNETSIGLEWYIKLCDMQFSHKYFV